ncbi:GTPase, partial [Salegentibacter sp.]|uniref:GTPase n=1 Tax=Salegentibacter sp. TaxID=1903072 RepID=UPI003563D870
EMSIGGVGFRFIDTAGIRETQDVVESIGIKRTFEKISQAQVVVFLLDSEKFKVQSSTPSAPTPSALQASPPNRGEFTELLREIEKIKNKFPQKPLVIIANKIDQLSDEERNRLSQTLNQIEGSSLQLLSAKTGEGVEELKMKLLEFVNTGALRNNNTIVTNSRHYNALLKALEEINKVEDGLNNDLSGDLLAIDIREALHYFGEITGEVTNDELLGNIFSNFCIGK